MKKRLVEFLSFLASSNLLIAAAAACAILTSYLVFQLAVKIELLMFTFFATLFTYNFHRRIGDLKSSRISARWNTFWMILSLPFLAFFASKLSLQVLLILSFCGILSIAYAVPLIPSGKGRLSLRLVPRMKFWVIMIVWSFSVILLPLFNESNSGLAVLVYFIMQFSFIGALTVVFDIQDLKVDLPSQRTIPQVLGVEGAKTLAMAMLFLSGVAGCLLLILGFADLNFTMAQTLVVFASILVVRKAKTENHPLYFSLAVDGLIIIQTGLILLAEYLF